MTEEKVEKMYDTPAARDAARLILRSLSEEEMKQFICFTLDVMVGLDVVGSINDNLASISNPTLKNELVMHKVCANFVMELYKLMFKLGKQSPHLWTIVKQTQRSVFDKEFKKEMSKPVGNPSNN